MNENIDLTKILKDCPEGIKLYSTTYGEVEFDRIKKGDKYPIIFITKYGNSGSTTEDGRHLHNFNGECTLFPSKNQRDWSKFTAPWYKKEKFDPKTLQPYMKVLVRDEYVKRWRCAFFSYENDDTESIYKYTTSDNSYKYCIPYNDETKHLAGTTEEAPEFYRYWED